MRALRRRDISAASRRCHMVRCVRRGATREGREDEGALRAVMIEGCGRSVVDLEEPKGRLGGWADCRPLLIGLTVRLSAHPPIRPRVADGD